jgi:hypothetical protein
VQRPDGRTGEKRKKSAKEDSMKYGVSEGDKHHHNKKNSNIRIDERDNFDSVNREVSDDDDDDNPEGG